MNTNCFEKDLQDYESMKYKEEAVYDVAVTHTEAIKRIMNETN